VFPSFSPCVRLPEDRRSPLSVSRERAIAAAGRSAPLGNNEPPQKETFSTGHSVGRPSNRACPTLSAGGNFRICHTSCHTELDAVSSNDDVSARFGMVGGTGIEAVALPCETEVGCLQINDMRVDFPIATGGWHHVMSFDITQCHDRTVPKLSRRPLSRGAAHDPKRSLADGSSAAGRYTSGDS
jgi:hypothetical protein